MIAVAGDQGSRGEYRVLVAPREMSVAPNLGHLSSVVEEAERVSLSFLTNVRRVQTPAKKARGRQPVIEGERQPRRYARQRREPSPAIVLTTSPCNSMPVHNERRTCERQRRASNPATGHMDTDRVPGPGGRLSSTPSNVGAADQQRAADRFRPPRTSFGWLARSAT